MSALELQDKESHIGCEAVNKAIDNLNDDDFKVTFVDKLCEVNCCTCTVHEK
jgi:hypothetical protein